MPKNQIKGDIAQIIAKFITEPYYIELDNDMLVLWAYPYTPYNNLTIDAYYVASHDCFRQATELIGELTSCAYRAEHTRDISLQRYALNCGLAEFRGANGLVYNSKYGSRYCIGSIRILCYKHTGTIPARLSVVPCDNCTAPCMDACPTGALTRDGQDYSKCLRQIMNTPNKLTEGNIRGLGGRVLGCDICQRACPVNSDKYIDMPNELYDTISDLTDDNNIRKLAQFVGSNMSKPRIISAITILNNANNLM